MVKNTAAVITVIVMFLMPASCGKPVEKIAQVTYVSTAGTILPELRWVEQITTRPGQVSLVRSGMVETTQVNAGSWSWEVEEAPVRGLFEELEKVEFATIQRHEPSDPPDGGNMESYSIFFENGEVFTLTFDPGVSYSNGENVTALIKYFISTLDLPTEAANRYQLPSP